MIFDTVVPMTNFLEQHHTRPRLVAVVGGRRRPAPAVSATRQLAPAASATRDPARAVSAIRSRPVRAATRAGRDLAEPRRRAGHARRDERLTAV
jgi:hypothetical protein